MVGIIVIMQEIAGCGDYFAASIGNNLALWTIVCQQTHYCIHMAFHYLQLFAGILSFTYCHYNDIKQYLLHAGTFLFHLSCNKKRQGW